jgi:hypothetical protein
LAGRTHTGGSFCGWLFLSYTDAQKGLTACRLAAVSVV